MEMVIGRSRAPEDFDAREGLCEAAFYDGAHAQAWKSVTKSGNVARQTFGL